MADAVNVRVLQNGPKNYVVRLLCTSDGTGESDVVKIDKSALVNGFNVEPSMLKLCCIEWSIQGFSYVALEWDHATDDPIINMGSGNGWHDYEAAGNLPDPLSAGGTGDILLSSFGAIAGATYDILAKFRKAENAAA